eukprot:PLAT7004.15.p1 GENE.PLAT7004.15~~PLAT7004.15.p1  ORF type:complete len:1137 (-),score=513.15 PLAT7004.15:123-3533(-)
MPTAANVGHAIQKRYRLPELLLMGTASSVKPGASYEAEAGPHGKRPLAEQLPSATTVPRSVYSKDSPAGTAPSAVETKRKPSEAHVRWLRRRESEARVDAGSSLSLSSTGSMRRLSVLRRLRTTEVGTAGGGGAGDGLDRSSTGVVEDETSIAEGDEDAESDDDEEGWWRRHGCDDGVVLAVCGGLSARMEYEAKQEVLLDLLGGDMSRRPLSLPQLATVGCFLAEFILAGAKLTSFQERQWTALAQLVELAFPELKLHASSDADLSPREAVAFLEVMMPLVEVLAEGYMFLRQFVSGARGRIPRFTPASQDGSLFAQLRTRLQVSLAALMSTLPHLEAVAAAGRASSMVYRMLAVRECVADHHVASQLLSEAISFYRSQLYLLRIWPWLVYQQAQYRPITSQIRKQSTLLLRRVPRPWFRLTYPATLPTPLMQVVLPEAVMSIAVSVCTRLLVVGRRSGAVHVHDSLSGAQLLRLEGLRTVTSVQASNDSCSACATGGSHALVWELATGKLLVSLEHGAEVTCASWSNCCRFLFTGCADGSANVWELSSGRAVLPLAAHRDRVIATCWSANDRVLMTACRDREIKVWSRRDGRLQRELHGHRAEITSAELSHCGSLVLSGSCDRTARIWSVTSGKELHILGSESGTHNSAVTAVAFDSDAERAVTAGNDGAIRIWHVDSGVLLAEQATLPGAIGCLAFSGQTNIICGARHDRILRYWSVPPPPSQLRSDGGERSSESKESLPSSELSTSSSVLAAAGLVVASELGAGAGGSGSSGGSGGGSGGAASGGRLWERTSSGLAVDRALLSHSPSSKAAPTEDGPRYQHEGKLTSVSLSADGKHIASSGEDRTVRVWSSQTGRQLLLLDGHDSAVTYLQFAQEARLLVTGAADGSVRVWALHTGEQVQSIQAADGAVKCCDLNSDGSRVVIACSASEVAVHHVESGELELELAAHTAAVLCSRFSRDGLRILSGSADGSLCLWDSFRGDCLLQMQQGSSPLRDCSFSFDSKQLLAAYDDGTTRVWSAEDGSCSVTVAGHRGAVLNCAWSPCDQAIATVSADSTLRLWDADSGAMLALYADSMTCMSLLRRHEEEHDRICLAVGSKTGRPLHLSFTLPSGATLPMSPPSSRGKLALRGSGT